MRKVRLSERTALTLYRVATLAMVNPYYSRQTRDEICMAQGEVGDAVIMARRSTAWRRWGVRLARWWAAAVRWWRVRTGVHPVQAVLLLVVLAALILGGAVLAAVAV